MRPWFLTLSRAPAFIIFIASFFLPFSSLSQTNFVALRPDGAWTWYNDPRALFHNGVLYFGYVRARDSKTVLSAYDLKTGLITDLRTRGFSQLHGTDQTFSYRFSNTTNPVSPADWGAEQVIASSGAGLTYANPYQLSAESGMLYNYARDLNFNPTVFTSTNGGLSWSSPALFIRTGTGSIRPYVKYSSDYAQRIDFLYTDGHPRDVTNSLYHLYYQGGSYYKTDETFVMAQ
jgi:hypothetical protein